MNEGEWRSVSLGENGGAFYLLVLSAVILFFGTSFFLVWMFLLDPRPPVGILAIVGVCGLVMLYQGFDAIKYVLIATRTVRNVVIRNGQAGLVLYTNRAIPLRNYSISRDNAKKYLKRKKSKLFPEGSDIGIIIQESRKYYLPGDIQGFDVAYEALENCAMNDGN